MRNLAALLIALAFLRSPHVEAGRRKDHERCRDGIARMDTLTVSPSQRWLVLPRRSERRLIGALAYRKNRPYLAVTGYHYKHEDLDRSLRRHDAIGEKLDYVWLGELLLKNPWDWSAIGHLGAANEVAGFFLELQPQGHRNDVKELKRVLEEHFPEMIGETPVWLTFEKSQSLGQLHLFPGIDPLEEKFKQMQAQSLRRKDETFRHFLKERATCSLLQLDNLYENWDDFENLVDGVQSSLQMGREFLQLYTQIFLNDGAFPHPSRNLLNWLSLYSARELKKSEWKEFTHAASIFNTLTTNTQETLYEQNTVDLQRKDPVLILDLGIKD